MGCKLKGKEDSISQYTLGERPHLAAGRRLGFAYERLLLSKQISKSFKPAAESDP